MKTALDSAPERLDQDERDFVNKIREHGWFATHVFDDGTGEPSNFSYTTDFCLNTGQPEAIIFGLSNKVAHQILWDVFNDAKANTTLPLGVCTSNVFGKSNAYIFDVGKQHYKEHLGWSLWFYGGDEFECVQIVWSDTNGVFPWQAGFEEQFHDVQPDLSATGWLKELAQ